MHSWHQNVDFFGVYAGLVNFKSSNLHILKKIKHFDREKSRNRHILKKIKKIDREKSPNLDILKKIKHFDSEKSPNLEILKKIKKIKNFRLYVGLTGIDELVLDFFEYIKVW